MPLVPAIHTFFCLDMGKATTGHVKAYTTFGCGNNSAFWAFASRWDLRTPPAGREGRCNRASQAAFSRLFYFSYGHSMSQMPSGTLPAWHAWKVARQALFLPVPFLPLLLLLQAPSLPHAHGTIHGRRAMRHFLALGAPVGCAAVRAFLLTVTLCAEPPCRDHPTPASRRLAWAHYRAWAGRDAAAALF